jgi:hypothetical protein
MTIAAGRRHVETRRDVPAEIAIELVVGLGFGQHGCWRILGYVVMAGLVPAIHAFLACRAV